jgi:hypothetical protein
MSYLDDLLGKVIQLAGVNLPMRKTLNFVSGATVVDNPTNGSTDVTISGGSGGGTAYAGTNPNAGGDSIAGTRGDFLRNTGAWNGFEGWSCITTGTPGIWVPVGRGGQITQHSGSYQALSTDLEVWATSTSAVYTITLPDITTIADGFDLPVKDRSFSASGNNLLVVGHASETIDGQAQFIVPPFTNPPGIPADGSGAGFVFVKSGSLWSVR